MHANVLIAAVVALATSTSALTIRNKHVADFRLFGEEGCYKKNEGVWTVIDDDFKPNECKSLDGNPAKSILNIDTNQGCTFSLYSDEACSAGKKDCQPGECCNNGQDWKAWSMVC
ncbi:hypothetical protein QQS21_005801 [Conoideocrella luteorostrata]|uniref:SSCRP protein n=1 Tax=Conoideocrella luteorostrata TaxID=1105319 RepID=A0AAJ0CNT3_9HYPO|nr:hypothetical protein QQS21_005801 [Conoideocrella luteorostrata]